MSADLLRRAAAKLREHAEAATPGPWNADPSEIYGDTIAIWVAESLNDSLPDGGAANSLYIALMSPSVGLALADLLDGAADEVDMALAFGHLMNWDNAKPLLKLARVILREPEEAP